MKPIFPFILTATALISLAFTNCTGILFFQQGASMTMTNYDKDGDITGSYKTDYLNVRKTDSGQVVDASQEFFDKKGKSTNKSTYSIRCNKNILYFDMKMMTTAQAAMYKDFDMTIEGADLQIPSSLTVGQTLPDANISMTFSTKGSSNPIPMMNMAIKIHNRKVEAKESVTTTAGTFDCFKITEDVEVNSLFKMQLKSINWFSYEAGNVKTESYKDNGKMMSYSLLTALKK